MNMKKPTIKQTDAFVQGLVLALLLSKDRTVDDISSSLQLEISITMRVIRAMCRTDQIIMQPYTAKEVAYGKRAAKALDITLKRLAAGKPGGKLLERYKAYVPARYHITVKGSMHLIELEEAA